MTEELACHGPPTKKRRLSTKEPRKSMDGQRYEVPVQEKHTVVEEPLLFFFDMETTGLSVDFSQITEIAGKVTGVPPSYVTQQCFSMLVRPSCSIQQGGTIISTTLLCVCILQNSTQRSNLTPYSLNLQRVS